MEGEGDAHFALTAEGPVTLHEGAERDAAFEPLREMWIELHEHAPDWADALVELHPQRLFSYAASG